jgi:hypothetical protein
MRALYRLRTGVLEIKQLNLSQLKRTGVVLIELNSIIEVQFKTLLAVLQITSDELPAQFGFPDEQED